jgi:hypothetical protein
MRGPPLVHVCTLCEQERQELEQRMEQAATAHAELAALQGVEEPSLR